jgi:hypothetical protein
MKFSLEGGFPNSTLVKQSFKLGVSKVRITNTFVELRSNKVSSADTSVKLCFSKIGVAYSCVGLYPIKASFTGTCVKLCFTKVCKANTCLSVAQTREPYVEGSLFFGWLLVAHTLQPLIKKRSKLLILKYSVDL